MRRALSVPHPYRQGKVVAVDEDSADLLGVVGILAVVGIVALFEEAGLAVRQEPPRSSSKRPTTSAM